MPCHFECGTCRKAFPAGWKARQQHLDSTGHRTPAFECDTCSRFFTSERARFQHMDDANHFAWQCSICDYTWPSEQDRQKHEERDHFYCSDCNRRFQNYNNLKMHFTSRTHRPTQIQCPFCKRSLPSATGLTHHLERGSCPNASGLNRETLYKFIRSKDPGGSITKNLIGWHESASYEASNSAFNHVLQAWECYFCHRLFRTVASLNQHLNSPVRMLLYPSAFPA